MKALSRVLCAVDLDEPGRAAFAQALALARVHDAKLVIVCAVPPDQPFNWRASERVSYLLGLRAHAEAAKLDVRVIVQSGDPALLVQLHARNREPDLVIVSSGHGAADGQPFGSLAEDVLRFAEWPTLVVRPDAGTTPAAFDNVLCALDLPPPPPSAIEPMLSLVNPREHRITLLHVLAGSQGRRAAAKAGGPPPPDYDRRRGAAALQELQRLIPADRAGSVIARVSVGPAGSGIVSAAASAGADLIVLGARSRSRAGRRLFGVTKHVLNDAACPVLGVPLTRRITAGDADRRAA